MHRRLLILLILCGISLVHAHSQIQDGTVLSQKPVSLPAFESVKEIAQYATPAEYSTAVSDKTFALERIEYASDGLTVGAYVYRPAKTNGKYPVIIFNRGSFVVHDQAPVLLTMFRRLGLRGFVVVAPMLRGSDGTSGHDELGGADLHDIANVFPVLKKLDYADTTNVFMYGESRGGIMTLLSIRAGMPIKAAATFGAITDMEKYLANDPRAGSMSDKIWPDFEQHKEEILKSRSAQRWAEEINVPILLMQGAKDPQVPPVQTLQLAEKLATAKKNYGVVIYPGDNHILSHNREDRDRRVADWFLSFVNDRGSK